MSAAKKDDDVGCGCAIILGLIWIVSANWDTIVKFATNPRLWVGVAALVAFGWFGHVINEPKRRKEEAKRKAEEAKQAEAQREAAMERERDEREADMSRRAEARRRAEERERMESERMAERERQEREAEVRFCRHLFCMLAKMAKADGHVEEQEVKMAEKAFEYFKCASQRRTFCSNVFNDAIKNSRTIYFYAERFAREVAVDELNIFVYELLWDVACADGRLHHAEKEILQKICVYLHIPEKYFDINYRRRRGSFTEGSTKNSTHEAGDGKSHANGWHSYVSGKSPIVEAYVILESEPTATEHELKHAYRKMAKRYHPDLLRSNGVPEEMIAKATEKMAQVNAAWEDIRKARKFT